MKILFIQNYGDNGFLKFKEDFKGTPVNDVIEKIEKEEYFDTDDYSVELHEVGEVSDTCIEFTRNYLIDYDHGKHENFLIEGETI